MNSLVIWGMGGHGKVVLDAARSMARFPSIAFVDDAPPQDDEPFRACPVLGAFELLDSATVEALVVAIGSNPVRARCYSRAQSHGFRPATLIHAAAVIDATAAIGPGTVVMAGAIVNADARIGENCIINTGAIVEHDCIIGDHVHISPRVALGGGVTIGSYAHIGIGAVVLPGAVVGEGAVVGAGAVVLRAVEPNTTVVGIPAKALPSGTAQNATNPPVHSSFGRSAYPSVRASYGRSRAETR